MVLTLVLAQLLWQKLSSTQAHLLGGGLFLPPSPLQWTCIGRTGTVESI